eukprot:scaffold2481_cov83-Skeletonema_dohrnii-CCMP3373.AAC.4
MRSSAGNVAHEHERSITHYENTIFLAMLHELLRRNLRTQLVSVVNVTSDYSQPTCLALVVQTLPDDI